MKGLLFKPDMIQAIRDKRKTVTRRVIKPQPERGVICKCPGCANGHAIFSNFEMYHEMRTKTGWIPIGKAIIPRYQAGEMVYIKEAWCLPDPYDKTCICYKASNDPVTTGEKWVSPLFMPEWAARDFITFTDVSAERLQELTPLEAVNEGFPVYLEYDKNWEVIKKIIPVDRFRIKWDSINKDYQWESNPWVFRYEFEKVNG